jgi:hypothetical protein
MRMVFVRLLLLAIVCPVLILAACANRGAPPGGPPDTTEPFVAEISPASGSVAVDTASHITIAFSERMKKRTVETGVVVSPPCRWKKRYWEDLNYVLEPQQGLKDDVTYLVSVSNKVQDAHGVAMKSTFVSGFSTGDTLNAGVVSGSVRWKTMDVVGAVIFLFESDGPDSAAAFPPGEPLYVTLSGPRGQYGVPYVDMRHAYKAFAIIDENLSNEYDEDEKVGCYDGRVEFGEVEELTGIDITICGETLTGSITGSIDTASVADTLSVSVEAQSVSDSSLVYGVRPAKGGDFEIGCVEPGDYILSAFHDANINLSLDPEDSILVELPDTFRVDSCSEPPVVKIELGHDN